MRIKFLWQDIFSIMNPYSFCIFNLKETEIQIELDYFSRNRTYLRAVKVLK